MILKTNYNNNLFKFLVFICLYLACIIQNDGVYGLARVNITDLYNYKQAKTFDPNAANIQPVCGYESCPPTSIDRLNVHLVPHSHDDVGWLKTVDQYYYNTKNKYAPVGVQHIYDSVIPQLVMDPTKRFIAVEMGFFTKWWAEQDDKMKVIVKRLVNEGRLEFINGGWCMNDEATTNYQSTIEQMTLGLKFLSETFGPCGQPKVGWQIDPFGHSNEQASLFAQFGFDGMFFSRISYENKERRKANKSLDILWHGDAALPGQTGSIFTNIFRDTYDAPQNFCFDVLCQEDNLVDNKKSYEYNIEQRAEEFVKYLKNYAKTKEHNHILIPMGGDFQYSAAGHNFKNIDKLIKQIRASNHSQEMHIFYSTPTCYQLDVHNWYKKNAKKIPEKFDDFMPYDSTPTVWWSGYFTSKPSIKLIERETANLLQVSRFISLANLLRHGNSTGGWINSVKAHETKCLMPLWEVLGDLQHHDSITGTSKAHVDKDYIRRVVDANNVCAKFIGDLRRQRINDYLKRSPNYEHLRESGKRFKLDPVYLEDTMFCPYLNISQCDAIEANVDPTQYIQQTTSQRSSNFHLHPVNGETLSSKQTLLRHKHLSKVSRSSEPIPNELETKAVLVNVYNPLAKPINQQDIRLPCMGECNLNKVKVIHLSTNETMRLTRLRLPAGIIELPFRDALTTYEVMFYANIPALGYSSYVFEDLNKDEFIEEEAEFDNEALPIGNRNEKRSILNAVNQVDDKLSYFEDSSSTKESLYRCKKSPDYSVGHVCDLMELDLDFKQVVDGFSMMNTEGNKEKIRFSRDSSVSQQSTADRVIVKFDLNAGMIVGLKRVSDGSLLNITQKFGYYFPANTMARPGAYIFRPNTSEPYLFDKPIRYKMYKRKSGSFIEIHQKWADWLWQTIRVDAKKNYIEFDYVVGPIPVRQNTMRPSIFDQHAGVEVVTRYITNMVNHGIFLTDSNDRQLMMRHRLRSNVPEQLGGSFFPVVSTIMLKSIDTFGPSNGNTSDNNNTSKCNKCSAEAVAIIVDRAQGGTSLNEGQLELLIHRRQLEDDNFGVGEPLDEPGEDGRGLVIRGKHKVYIKFQELQQAQNGQDGQTTNQRNNKIQIFKVPQSGKSNLEFEKSFYFERNTPNYLEPNIVTHHPPTALNSNNSPKQTRPHPTNITNIATYIVHDPIYNDLNQESKKQTLRPLLTFDRLRVGAYEFIDMIASNNDGSKLKTDLTLLNNSLPNNIHILTLQPWASGNNQILIRIENMDNPLTIHPMPDYESYLDLFKAYKTIADVSAVELEDTCQEALRPRTEVDLEYIIKRIRIFELEELSLGANTKLSDVKRLDWIDEEYDAVTCGAGQRPTSIKIAPREIRTFIAKFAYL